MVIDMPSGVRYESVAICGLEDQGHMLLTYNDGAQHSIIIPHVTKCEPEIKKYLGLDFTYDTNFVSIHSFRYFFSFPRN